jgi:C1A family cysteine protease
LHAQTGACRHDQVCDQEKFMKYGKNGGRHTARREEARAAGNAASTALALGCVLGVQVMAHSAHAQDGQVSASNPYVVEIQGARFELDTLHPVGAQPDSDELLESKLSKPVRAAASALPSEVDLTACLPPPGDQGQQGSCVGWAVGYDTKSFDESVEMNWPPSVTNHQFSPSWVYNQINGGADNGSSVSDALDLIVNKGADTLDQFPYSDRNFTKQPDAASYARAARYKAKEWHTVKAHVDDIKTVLATRNTVIIAFAVMPDFDALNATTNTVYDTAQGTTPSCSRAPCIRGYHAVSIIGYDDAKQAFKFINSWGTGFGSRGYGWMAYSFVDDPDLALGAYYLVDKPNEPSLAGPAGPAQGYDGGGATRIVYRGKDSHVHELNMTDHWSHFDMNAIPGAVLAAGDPMGLVAGVARVLYRGVDNHIHEFHLDGGWGHFDFAGLPGMVSAAGNPFAYVDAHGTARIVFRGSDAHIHEIFLTDRWYTWDMNSISGAANAAGDPMGFVSNGGVPRVLYRGVDGHIHEFNLTDHWSTYDFNGLPGMVQAAGNPTGYLDAQGTVRIDFRGVDGHIHEINLTDHWSTYDFSGLPGMVSAAGDPVGYVGGGATRIVFRGVDKHIHEINLTDHWSHFDMNGVPGSVDAVGDPVGHNIGGVPRVDYVGVDGHLHENWLLNTWQHFDFSGLLE